MRFNFCTVAIIATATTATISTTVSANRNIFGISSRSKSRIFGKHQQLNNKFISISHSFDYCGVIVSNVKVGLDIEKFRSKILNISKKFVSQSDLGLIKLNSIENVTKVWSIKEAVFKAFGHNKIDFKKNIIIKSVNEKFNKANVLIFKNEISENYSIEIYNFSEYICCVAKLND